MNNLMNRFGTLRLAAVILCMARFGPGHATERHVPAQYPTIQQAVNAAVSGDTVLIAAGNYTEQVVVAFKNGLTLTGEPGTVLHAFPGMSASLAAYNSGIVSVCAIYRSDVVVRGLHFEGEKLAGSFTAPLDGLAFLGGGGMVTECTFSGFRQEVGTAGNGRALYCVNYVETGAGVANVTITESTFNENQQAITLRGDPRSIPDQVRLSAIVRGNTITGFGPFPGWNSGIVIDCGATGEITRNVLSDFAGTGDSFSPAIAGYDGVGQIHGRFVPLQRLTFEGNTLTNNGQHLMLVGANEGRVVNNKFIGAVPGGYRWGGVGLSGTNLWVANNNFSDMPTGTLLVGTERWTPPWPAVPPAVTPSLVANWFCNVPEPIRVNPLITLMQEQGTQTNCPFAPKLEFQASGNGEILPVLRGWHGDLYVIEASTDLEDWAPVYTGVMTLPLFEFSDTGTPSGSRRFYRAFKK
jgi:hypothetical protein